VTSSQDTDSRRERSRPARVRGLFASLTLATLALAALAAGESTAGQAVVSQSAVAQAVVGQSVGGQSVGQPAADEPTSAALVQQPRPFGYMLGDTLIQRVLLRSRDHDFEPASLPPSERASLWFARRASSIEVAENKSRWLVLDYQLINAPEALTTVNLPGVVLKAKTGGETLTVATWPISITSLTPRAVFAKGGLQELRPDHPAPLLAIRPLQTQLEIWLTAFAVATAAWLAWWWVRALKSANTQPFAHALSEMRGDRDGNGPRSWVALHRALDKTAGQSLQLSTLPALFKRAPHLQPQRRAIEAFYGESYQRFFGNSAEPSNMSPRALCVTLRRLERRHES
jgi:mxaA protein